MHESGFYALIIIWAAFGLYSIFLFFKEGLAGDMLRRTFASDTERRVSPLGYLVLVALLPVILVLGALSYLYAVSVESKIQCKLCGGRRGFLDVYCSRCETERPLSRPGTAPAPTLSQHRAA